jgi:hypothetical protein
MKLEALEVTEAFILYKVWKTRSPYLSNFIQRNQPNSNQTLVDFQMTLKKLFIKFETSNNILSLKKETIIIAKVLCLINNFIKFNNRKYMTKCRKNIQSMFKEIGCLFLFFIRDHLPQTCITRYTPSMWHKELKQMLNRYDTNAPDDARVVIWNQVIAVPELKEIGWKLTGVEEYLPSNGKYCDKAICKRVKDWYEEEKIRSNWKYK